MGFEYDLALGLQKDRLVVCPQGVNPSIDVGTPEDLVEQGGDYTGFPQTIEPVEIFSSSDDDTYLTGTGLQSVRAYGLDHNYEIQSEAVYLTGTTPVVIAPRWRVHLLVGFFAGAAGTNVGTITCRQQTTTTNVFATITPGSGRSKIAAYTIPGNYRGVLCRVRAALRRGGAGIYDREAATSVRVREFECVYREVWPGACSTQAPLNEETCVVLEPATDVILRVTEVSAAATSVVGGFLIKMARVGRNQNLPAKT